MTIQPGAVIKLLGFSSGLVIQDNGLVIADGTSEKPIFFTSFRDDSVGGNTNYSEESEGSIAPSKGDWQSVVAYPGTGAFVFDYCTFRYGGAGSSPALYLNSTDQYIRLEAHVTNCTFANNNYDGLSALYANSSSE